MCFIQNPYGLDGLNHGKVELLDDKIDHKGKNNENKDNDLEYFDDENDESDDDSHMNNDDQNDKFDTNQTGYGMMN